MYLVYTSCLQNIENWKSEIWSFCESNGAGVEWRAVKMFVVAVGCTGLWKWKVN
jgi:hypothetical protein